jgi:hypothetical protein
MLGLRGWGVCGVCTGPFGSKKALFPRNLQIAFFPAPPQTKQTPQTPQTPQRKNWQIEELELGRHFTRRQLIRVR